MPIFGKIAEITGLSKPTFKADAFGKPIADGTKNAPRKNASLEEKRPVFDRDYLVIWGKSGTSGNCGKY